MHAVVGRKIAVVKTIVAIIRREVVLSAERFKLWRRGRRAIPRSQIAF